MNSARLGIEQLNDRVVLTAGVGGLISEGPVVEPVASGWGMAQYQYSFEGTYNHRDPVDPATDLKGQATDTSHIIFIGGYGAASYQYANETTY